MAEYIVHKAIEIDAVSSKQRAIVESCTRWVVSPKYDGCHAIICFADGKHVGTYSRTGEEVHSLNHVARDLLIHYPKLGTGQWAICGEAWNPYWQFNQISGAFRRQDPSASDLYFVPFDFVPWDEAPSGGPLLNPTGLGPGYADRIGVLYLAFQPATSTVIRPKYNEIVGTFADAFEEARSNADKLKQFGNYDGTILARAGGRYIVGSGKGAEFIKVKPLASYSVVVIRAELATGDKTGKNTAALVFELDGKQQRVSTGLTQGQVDQIADAPTFAANWLGKTIEVEAMGITSGGYLREPRFKGIRTDA